VKRFIILSTLGIMLASIQAVSAGEFSWPMFVPANIGGERLQNRLKTESLDGCWSFNYTIISNWTTKFCLDKSALEESEQYVFFIKGFDSSGNTTVGGYLPEEDFYHVRVAGSLFWEYFTFDFIPSSPSTVEGCYYQIDPNDGSPSNCFPMTGHRTNSKITNKSAQPAGIDPGLQKQREIAQSAEGKTKSTAGKNLFGRIGTLKKAIGLPKAPHQEESQRPSIP